MTKSLIKTSPNTIKRDRVKAAIRAHARKIGPGAKLPTVVELCKSLKVANVTLHTALNEIEAEGIIRRKRGSGIYVREQIDERSVAVVMELDFSIPDFSYFWRRVTQQVRSRLAALDVRSRFYAGFSQASSSRDEVCREFAEDVANNRLNGAIVVQGSPASAEVKILQRRNLPVVGNLPCFKNYVAFDMAAQVRVATECLLAAGRRNLAYMGYRGGSRRDEFFTAFAETLAKHGLPVNERFIRNDFQPNQPGAGWEEFREIWMGSGEKPDGLVVADDVLFQGVARAIGEFGIRVPEQLLVTAHSNHGARGEYPFPLWRMVTDPDVAAQAQVDLLLALMRGEPVAQRQINLPVQFVMPDPAVVVRPGTREVEQVTTQRSS